MNPVKKLKNRVKLKLVLHPLFIILGIFLTIVGEIQMFLIVTFSALLHELGHFVVASKFGYKMEKIRLMPFGAELFGDTDSFIDRDEVYIALAGPIVNFFIALICVGSWWIVPDFYGVTKDVFQNNIAMGVFNLLPIFPLDGGRILLSVLSKRMQRSRAARLVKAGTRTFAIILFVIFIFSIFTSVNISFGIMAVLLYFSASFSSKEATYQKIKLNNLVQSNCVEWVNVTVPEDMRIYELKKHHIRNKIINFTVISKLGELGFSFSELDLECVYARLSQSATVKELKPYLGK